jgi:hypothetical protein
MRFGLTLVCGLIASAIIVAAVAEAQPAPPVSDPVEALQQRLTAGETPLEHSPGASGYLTSLLQALHVPVDSQVLVFSKTSFQAPIISPANPRAVYFNDDTAVGFVPGGRLLEITTTDSNGRIAFYTLDAAAAARPQFEREDFLCMACHAAAAPTGGLIVANVIPDEDGTPLFIDATRLFDITDGASPFEGRWGGWYVTGEHGAMRHNGNVHLTAEKPIELDPRAGLNIVDLSSRLDLKPYPAASSDIVALMTLEHQLGAMNRIWRLQSQKSAENVEALVVYLLGAGAPDLPSPVKGVSSFTRTFPARGPRDPKGRSLRDFDLQTRLFRYPLSYAIYSRAFDAIDLPLREQVYRRLFDVLSGDDTSGKFASLSPERRRAALEILAATKPDIPAYWRAAAAAPVT